MLRQSATRRIMVATIAIVIVGILYLFPSQDKNMANIKVSVGYQEGVKRVIYVLNKDNYVVRTNMVGKSEETIDKIRELIQGLTIDSGKSDCLPQNFKGIIPKNTKILSVDLSDKLLKINFSKEFLNVEKEMEEKLIEALVYTLTELEEVDDIMIFVENDKLFMLPQSKIKLPSTLNREFGINKVYDISNIKNLAKTTIYYVGKEEDLIYYIPVTKFDNNQNNKVEIIIKELKSSPLYEMNLISYLASAVELQNYEILENQVELSFNNKIFSDLEEKNILEEVKYSIFLSLRDSLNIKEVIFKVDDEMIETFKEY